jgi:hypothetical protein
MNHLLILPAAFLFALLASVSAQTAQPPATLAPAPLNTWDLSWLSVTGRTYFVQISNNLTLWQYGPCIQLGDASVLGCGLTSSTVKFFARLRYTDAPTTNPDLEDFDGDGIPSIVEVAILGTDPLGFDPNVDTDGDGLRDSWEIYYWGNLTAQNGAGDADGDRLTNKEEFDLGLDPKVAESSSSVERANYTYDLAGRLTGVAAPELSTTFTPDAEGNILTAQ